MHNEKDTRYFWFIIDSETLDLIFDWTFTYQKNNHNDPHVERSIKMRILGFAIWGTMLYILTIISLFCDSHNDDDDEECSCIVSFSLLSTVTEDLPQIVLAINVAHHMTHLISVIQILKAMYGVNEPIVRITKISNDMNEKNMTNKHASTKCQKLFDWAFSLILCLSSCVLCILVFNLK